MKLTILMILLVSGNSGEVKSSFAVQETMESCAGMSAGIQEVFKQTGIKVIELDCVASGQKFSEFRHDVPIDAPRYHYFLDYRQGLPKVTAMKDEAACHLKRDQLPKDITYCTISPQNLLD